MSLRALLNRHRLDEELAAGADPEVDAEHLERARELTSEESRRRIAASLMATIGEAETRPRFLSSKVPVARDAIRESRAELEEVASLLASPDANPQGVAMLRLLLTDGTSPLYAGGTATQLRWKLAEASAGVARGPAAAHPFDAESRFNSKARPRGPGRSR